LALILYERIKNDVNRFVDEVYAPYQTKKLLLADHEDFKKGDPDSLFSVLDAAIKQPNNPEIQKTALLAMDVFLQVVRAEVEAYRSERLAPILAQEKEVLSAIDRSYNQIHYANSIVTGHLASILEVHDAQEDLLNEFGIQGLRQDIGQRLSATSSSIAEFVRNAKRLEGTVEDIEKNMEELTRELDILVGRKETKEE
jgi:archaellum component FlaC